MKPDPTGSGALPADAPLSQLLKARLDRAMAWSERFVSGRFWTVKVLVVCVLFTVLLSGGIDFDNLRKGYYPSYYQKIEHPLLNLVKYYAPGSHDEKLNYRLTVPVLLHPLGLNRELSLHWVLPALTILGVCCVICASSLIASRITGDRVAGLFLALNVSATYIGSFGFIMCYDAIAMAQVLLAMIPGIHWALRGLLVFTASFTDERAFLASGLILAGEWCAPPASSNSRPRLLNKGTLAVIGAMGIYWVVRLWLTYGVGLASVRKGVGPGSLTKNIKFGHPGVWFALEGGWLLVLLAVIALWNRREKIRGWLFVLSIGAILVFSFSISDLVRSTSYLCPAAFVALAIISRDRKDAVRLYCLGAFLISAIGGNYNVYVGQITWFQPLPVVLLDHVARDLYYVFRILVFHGMP